MTELCAGRARIDITPSVGIAMGGYWERSGAAVGVASPLYARAAAFQCGEQRCALVSLDLVAIAAESASRIRARVEERFGLPAASLMICASHTHSGPLTLPYRGMGTVDVDYLARVEEAVAAAVGEALVHTEPVQVYYARVPVKIGINRRRSLRSEISHAHLVWCEGRSGAPLTIFQYACHPVVLGAQNRHISGDFVGEAARLIEEQSAGIALFINGACGDINPRTTNGTVNDAVALGRELATAALATRSCAERLSVDSIRSAGRTVDLPLSIRPPTSRLLAVLAMKYGLRRVISGANSGLFNAARARLQWAADAAREQDRVTQAFSIHGMALGELVLLGCEGELFARYQLEVEEVSQRRVVLCGLANGCIGYVPTADEYARGGYEIEEAHKVYPGTCCVAPESEERIRSAIGHLLAELCAD